MRRASLSGVQRIQGLYPGACIQGNGNAPLLHGYVVREHKIGKDSEVSNPLIHVAGLANAGQSLHQFLLSYMRTATTQ